MLPQFVILLTEACTPAIGKMPPKNTPEYNIWMRQKLYLYVNAKEIFSKDKKYWVEFLVILMKMPELSTLNYFMLNYKPYSLRIMVGNLYMSLDAINKDYPHVGIDNLKKNLEECVAHNKELNAIRILASIKDNSLKTY